MLPASNDEILKIMILDPKEVSKPKMSLIEVVRRHKIDFETKLQVVWSMYEVRNHKKTSENLVARRKFDQKS